MFPARFRLVVTQMTTCFLLSAWAKWRWIKAWTSGQKLAWRAWSTCICPQTTKSNQSAALTPLLPSFKWQTGLWEATGLFFLFCFFPNLFNNNGILWPLLEDKSVNIEYRRSGLQSAFLPQSSVHTYMVSYIRPQPTHLFHFFSLAPSHVGLCCCTVCVRERELILQGSDIWWLLLMMEPFFDFLPRRPFSPSLPPSPPLAPSLQGSGPG